VEEADEVLVELEMELMEIDDVGIVLALAPVLSLMLDEEDDEMGVALDLIEELVDEQLDTAVLWHMPMLGMLAAPVLCSWESAPSRCRIKMKYTHGRVRADAIKVRALQLAKHRKTSDEWTAKDIVLRARVRA
jgi:hypothetical protein